MNDLILFCGGGLETVSAMGKAKALGYSVCITDGDENSKGVIWAKKYGRQWGIASTYDAPATWEVVKPWVVDAVAGVAADVGPTISYVAKQAGCPHIPVSIAKLGQDKRALKDHLACKDARIHMPKFPDGTSRWVVVKPVDGRGARGVFRVRYNEMGKYVMLAMKESPTKTVIAEEWVEGPQVSTESVIKDGVQLFTGMTDRFYHFLDEQSPYVIENGGFGPSVFEGTSHAMRIRELMRLVVRALGIEDGTIKCDIILDKNNQYRPTLIECAIGRMSGGYMCSHYLPLAYGYDFLEAAFDVACGRYPRTRPHGRRHFVCGLYEYKESITSMKERGKFFMA
ncbi:ATP-grasp domain-containing protein, partial [Candidatus Bathyarchaeota archaeon]|nr:ATP-grasp domain-containing protein [Candidatus Bathyarchaeota archaeon]